MLSAAHSSLMATSSLGKKCCPILLFLRLLVQLVASASASFPTFSFIPEIANLTEGENRTVDLHVDVPASYFEPRNNKDWVIKISSIHRDIATIDSPVVKFKPDDAQNASAGKYSFDTTFTIKAGILGRTGVRARFVLADWADFEQLDFEPEKKSTDTMDVNVVRNKREERWSKIFVYTVLLFFFIGNILMGCELDLNMVIGVLKTPIGPMIGFFTQFVVMPLLAYVIARVILIPKGMFPFALGLFVTGCSPGGGGSNYWTLLLDGNVNLSVTMTFLSTVACLVMMPLWLMLLGHEFLQSFGRNVTMRVPYPNIVYSLVWLVVPLLIGTAIARKFPSFAAKCRKILRPYLIFALVFVVVFGCATHVYMWRIMRVEALIAGLLLPWCGFMCGCFIAIGLGRSPADVTAIAIETGIQNTGVAIVLLKWSFSQPDADISALLPVIVACFTPGPLILGAGVHMLLKRIKKRTETASICDVEMPTKCKLPPTDFFEPNAEKREFLDSATNEQPLALES